MPIGSCTDTCDDLDEVYTAVVDTTQADEQMLAAMDGSTRNQVRQAARNGIVVRYDDVAGEWINDYVRLSSLTYQRQGLKSPLRTRFLEAVLARSGTSILSGREADDLANNPVGIRRGMIADDWRAAVALAYHDDEIVAASLFMWDRSTVFFLDNVSDRSKQKLRPNNAIIWSLMRWAHAEGFVSLDLVGANIPGIAAFKVGFGAELRPLHSVTHISSAGRTMYRVRRFGMKIHQDFTRILRGM